ncbi:hypothetical protein, partial [Pantoea sp. B65]|uniref:hypothetical protein n=1 Tax=Pantoea sp. B65 TaxID=2813359 RepID=UPI0039B41338
YYDVYLYGKLFSQTRWVEPEAEDASLWLVKFNHLPNDLLDNFIHMLKADVDYIIKSDKEYLVDSAFETLEAIITLLSIFSLAVTITPVAGASATATRVFAALTSWKTSLGLSSFTIFPNMILALSADRPEEAQRAWINAALGLAGEGASYLVGKYGAQAIIGLFKQGGQVIKVAWNQLPDSVIEKISLHVKQVFSTYRNEVCRINQLPVPPPAFGSKYKFAFIDIKAPAKTMNIISDFDGFPRFVNLHHTGLLKQDGLFTRQDKITEVVQQFLQSKGYQADIGGVLRWDSIGDSYPQVHYVVRVKSPAPPRNSEFAEAEDIIVDFAQGRFTSLDKKGESISGEELWQSTLAGLQHNQQKAFSIQWFDAMSHAPHQFSLLRQGKPLLISSFTDAMVIRPDWYKKMARRNALNGLEIHQAQQRQAIYQLEEQQINQPGALADGELISLKLGYLFSKGVVPAFNALGEKLSELSSQSISKALVALPAGDYRLVATDLRGISSDNQGNVTLTDFGSSARLLQQNHVRAFLPGNIQQAALAAEISGLYAPRLDDRVIYTAGGDNSSDFSAPQERVRRLADNALTLGKSCNHLRIPLVMALNSSMLTESQRANDSDSTISGTLSAQAIMFVLAPDDMCRQLVEVLAPLRAEPIPVCPLLIDYSPQLRQTLQRAEEYVLEPQFSEARQTLEGYEQQPWMPLINLQLASQLISHATAQWLRAATRADNYRHFLGHQPQTIDQLDQISEAQPGARLVFSEVAAANSSATLSHAMMMLENSTAIGANNQIIGGKAGWEKIYLQALNWIYHPQHGLVLEADGHQFRLQIQQSLAEPTGNITMAEDAQATDKAGE